MYFGNCEQFRHKLGNYPKDLPIVVCNPHPLEYQDVLEWAKEERTPFRLVLVRYSTKCMTYADTLDCADPGELIGHLSNVREPPPISPIIQPVDFDLDPETMVWPLHDVVSIRWLIGQAYAFKRLWLLPRVDTGRSGLQELLRPLAPISGRAALALVKWRHGLSMEDVLGNLGLTHLDQIYHDKPFSFPNKRECVKALLQHKKIPYPPEPMKWFDCVNRVITGPNHEFLFHWINHRLEEIKVENSAGHELWTHREVLMKDTPPAQVIKENSLFFPPALLNSDVKIRDIGPEQEGDTELDKIAANVDYYFEL